jgi:fumarate hydratase class II
MTQQNAQSQHRVEKDSMGTMRVPAKALYGAQTARAVENFPISGQPMPRAFVAALGLVKQAAAAVHARAGRLDKALADAIIQAAQEVIDGRLEEHFPVDVFQTGSGTSSNMNANEVIANRALQLLGGQVGSKAVHPNDHVNMGQSSNDVVPTAVQVAAALEIKRQLAPALSRLQAALQAKAAEFDQVVKVARTHLQDAVPIRLGQEFSGYADAAGQALQVVAAAQTELCELAIGGSAVGTGLNVPPRFAAALCRYLAGKTRLPFKEAANHFAAQSVPLSVLAASAAMRTTAIALSKIAGDIRLLGSGPRCGLGELVLPATQPGSSIMPGKVNPVICESVIQVACQVIGNDAAVAAASLGGVGSLLELHVAWPVLARNLLESINLLAAAARVFRAKCILGLKADEARCRELLERSLMSVTALAPVIGYDAAAAIAKQAAATGKTVRQLCLEKRILPKDKLDKLLDLAGQTGQ